MKFFKGSNYEKYYKDILPHLKKEKNQKYLFVVLTLTTSIFFFLFAINPTLSTIVRLRREVNDSRLVEQKFSEKINALSSLSDQYQRIQEDLPFIYDAVPLDPNAPVLVAQIQSIANTSQVAISRVEVSPIQLTDAAATVSSSFNFRLTAESEFANLQRFTDELIKMQRVVSINGISITKNTDQSQSLQLDLTGSAYYKKE